MKKSIVFFVITFLFLFSTNTYAAEVVWKTEKNVAIDKTWTVQFSEDIDATTVNNNNVYIMNQSNEKQESIISMPDANKIEITPIIHGYLPSNTYTLVIENVKSANGETLDQVVKMNFEIETWYTQALNSSEYLSMKSKVQEKIKNLKILYPIGNLSDYEYNKKLKQNMLTAETLQERINQLANVGDYEGKYELQKAQQELKQVNSAIEDLMVARKAQIKLRSFENVLIEYSFLYDRADNHAIIDKKIIEIERSYPVGNYSEYDYNKKNKTLMAEISKTQQKLNSYSNATTQYEKKMKKKYEDELKALEDELDELRTSWQAQLRIHNLEGLRN